ncbi:MAG: polymer-forming cytoskeletal protein [Pseudomonadota bacterium]|jgi:cytoskeletal protein CcmA (bactofilin family)|nr:polymer-forming cytoskeletal protein [Pseudomonadota bacterium]|tara:strand:- start:1371 stop:1796 length:426 start_codon:yes stop_codon:yes gene_type:complete
MLDKLLKKFKQKKTTRIDSLIGQNTEIQGELKFSGGVHIDGKIQGKVIGENDGSSLLSQSEYGEIEGEIRSPYIVINGIVNGDVHGSRHVELLSNAKIKGNVYYNLVELSVGAEVNGKLVHTPAKPEDEVGLELNYSEVSE